MIRSSWLRRTATALASPPSSQGRFSTTHPQSDAEWPLLKKRNRSSDQDTIHSGGASLIESLKSRQGPIDAEITHAQNKSGDSRVMLILHGLSPSLNASDFYRLAPSDLASWQSVIKKVQQQRNPATLEPLGRYHISFSSSTAAISYRDRLLRLHKLAHHRLTSASGLWEASIPRHLQSPAGDDPAAELEAFTATSGTHKGVDMQRRRVSVANKWAQKLSGIVSRFDFGEKPPVVLVHVYPPTLTAEDLGKHIRDDGLSRGCEWKVCPPQELQVAEGDKSTNSTHAEDKAALNAQPQTQREIDTREKLKSRFVVACADEAEARRFHRHWNQRCLTAGPGDAEAMRNVVHASIINW